MATSVYSFIQQLLDQLLILNLRMLQCIKDPGVKKNKSQILLEDK